MNWRLKIVLTAVFSFVGISLNAQDFRALEVGTSINYTLPSDDLDSAVDPQTNGELVVRYNFPYRIALRGSFAQNFKYTDSDVWDLYASSKAALGLEYHFNDFNIYDHRSQISPFVMIGFSYQFNHQYSKDIQERRDNWDNERANGFKNENNEPLTVDEINDLKKGLSEVLRDGGLKQFGIIGSLGVKYKITSFMIVSAELSAVYLGSDEYDIEESERILIGNSGNSQFRNNNGNDWYLNPNLTITIPLITFGPKF
jgi:hypothetical protein